MHIEESTDKQTGDRRREQTTRIRIEVVEAERSITMNIFRRLKVITVNDPTKKEQIQALFACYNIEYIIKEKEIPAKKTADAMGTGNSGTGRIKNEYSFYVDKDNSAIARELLHGF